MTNFGGKKKTSAEGKWECCSGSVSPTGADIPMSIFTSETGALVYNLTYNCA